MILQELIDTYEELKKYSFIIDRGDDGQIVIKFKNENFYHLVGLHKINIKMFFPNNIKSQDKRYKYMKKNVEKFNNILENQISDKDSLELRVSTFHHILDLLMESKETSLYNLKEKQIGSLYDGDYGLLKEYDDLYCLLGLKEEISDDCSIKCAPQSWMASNRKNRLVEFKRPKYMKNIIAIPNGLYDNEVLKN